MSSFATSGSSSVRGLRARLEISGRVHESLENQERMFRVPLYIADLRRRAEKAGQEYPTYRSELTTMAQAIESHWTALNNACSYFQPSPWAFEAKSAPTPTIEDLMDLQQNSELIDQVRITEREYEEAMEHYQGWILESWCWTYTEPSILKDELGPLLTRKGEESLASAQAFLMDELEWLSAGCRAASELGLRYIEALNDAQDIPQAEIFDWISAKAYMNEMSVTATSVFGLLDELDGMSDTNKRKEKEKYRSACQHWSDTVLEVQRNS